MSTSAREERQARIRTQRLAELGALLAGFAHEIRNPLSTIGLNLQLVLEDHGGADSPRDRRTHKRLQVVQGEVKRLQKILDEFLSFARAPEPQFAPVELNARLQVLADFHAPAFRERGVELRFYADAAVSRIEADWDHLQAAIVNLLRNAVDATPPGGDVLLSTARDADDVLVRVTDTGAGIPEDLRARVMEPYFSTKETGTGLGLPTVRRIVEEHGGSLSFSSDVGKGTQFTLRLPAKGPNGRARRA
jgi:signal transduction histidine kinase